MQQSFIISLFTFILFLNSTNGPLAQDCLQPVGKWVNENGSVLQIDSIDPSGMIKGLYRSHEGTEGQHFPLTGWWHKGRAEANDPAVSFTVYWKPYATITSWTGYCDLKEGVIRTLWHHIDPDAEYDFQKWSSQASVFKAFKQ